MQHVCYTRIVIKNKSGGLMLIFTMLLVQIKGFYHGITKIFLLVGSYTMLCWDVYVVVHVRTDCGV